MVEDEDKYEISLTWSLSFCTVSILRINTRPNITWSASLPSQNGHTPSTTNRSSDLQRFQFAEDQSSVD